MAAYDDEEIPTDDQAQVRKRLAGASHWRRAALVYRWRREYPIGRRAHGIAEPRQTQHGTAERPSTGSSAVGDESEQPDAVPASYRWTITGVPCLKIANPS